MFNAHLWIVFMFSLGFLVWFYFYRTNVISIISLTNPSALFQVGMRALHMLPPKANVTSPFRARPVPITDGLVLLRTPFCRTRVQLQVVWCFCVRVKQTRLTNLENHSFPLKTVFQSTV